MHRVWLRIMTPSSRMRLGLSLLSACLFALSLPPADLGLLFGWFALVPLAFAVRGLGARRAAIHGGVFGIVVAHLVFGWLFRFSDFRVHHGLVLGGYLALYPAVMAVILARFGFEARGLVLVPAAAIALEWVRGHAGFLAVPWASFGQTQHANVPLLQLASVGGEPLVGLVVLVANVAIAQLIANANVSKRPATAAVALVALVHIGGAAVLRTEVSGRELVVAAVQPAVLPKQRDAASFDRLLDLTRTLRATAPRLVVWPETAVGNIEVDLVTKLAIRDVVEELAAPVVFGSSETEKLAAGAASAPHRNFNSAYVMEPGKPVPAPYRKVKLLPFGEYQPITLPASIVPPMFDTERGERRVTLRTNDLLIEPIICWENLFADDVRATASDEPSVIAHVVNDAWFGPTSQPELHNLVSAFRAAESGRPLVLASNTGPSWIVDARGRVLARSPRMFEPAVVTATVRMPSGMTLYRRVGDASWAIPLGALCLVVLGRRARRPSHDRRDRRDQKVPTAPRPYPSRPIEAGVR